MRRISSLFLSGNRTETRELSITGIFFSLLSLEVVYEVILRNKSLPDCLWIAPLDAIIYTAICLAIFRLDLIRLSISYLALPYLFFLPGWLNIPAALIMSANFLYFFYQTFKENPFDNKVKISVAELLAFILIMAWVSLSGAGGHGYQTSDYSVHNSRLLDLINHAWPVHYGPDKNFVYYIGYFLPAAAIGKVFGANVGVASMFPWTLMGVGIAFRWLCVNSQWQPTALVAAAFILFGPIDIIGLIYLYFTTDGITPAFAWKVLRDNTDTLDFWTNFHSSFFIGNFLSNTFQLYWSPPQIIAGWIGAGTLMYSIENGRTRQAAFIFSLLSLWAPFVMIGLFPMIAGSLLLHGKKHAADVFTPANTLGAIMTVALLFVFYASGSMQKHDSLWLFSSKNHNEVLLMFVLSWGIFGMIILKHIPLMKPTEKSWAVLLAIAVFMAMLKTYGPYNDLLCRASAPLMFITLTILLRIIGRLVAQKAMTQVVFIVFIMAPGFLSAILQMDTAIEDYGHMETGIDILSISGANPNLGDDNSLFRHYLARKP